LDDEIYDKKGEKKNEEVHFLRVILHILNGKALQLRFNGKTLAPLQGQLALRREKFTLDPLPIGLLLPVIFPIEITNVGSSKIRYLIDKEKLYK